MKVLLQLTFFSKLDSRTQGLAHEANYDDSDRANLDGFPNDDGQGTEARYRRIHGSLRARIQLLELFIVVLSINF